MIKIFNDIFPLKTSRLIIRRTIIDDVDLILKMDKQEETQLYLGGLKNKSKEERTIFLENKINKLNTESLTICMHDQTKIGIIEIKINNDKAELSYIFDYDFCNKGYCTEACQKILEIMFNNLKLVKISADTVKYNNKSKRVLEKLGFKSKGINQNTSFIDYEITSIDYYK